MRLVIKVNSQNEHIIDFALWEGDFSGCGRRTDLCEFVLDSNELQQTSMLEFCTDLQKTMLVLMLEEVEFKVEV